MKKRILALACAAVLLTACLAGCANQQNGGGGTEPKNVAVKDIFDKMRTDVESPAGMAIEDDQLKELYGLDPEILDSYVAEMPMMNVKANELAIFKVKDSKDVDTVKKACEKRAETVAENFKTYLTDQAELAQNYTLKNSGNYVLFAMDENADDLVKIFDDLLK